MHHVGVVIIGGTVATMALGGKKTNRNSSSQTSKTPSITPTATPGIPAGFHKYSSDLFIIDYPSDWKKQASDGSIGEDFQGPEERVLQVLIQQNADATEMPALLDTFCTIFGDPIGSVTTVTIGGQRWQQETCGPNGTADGTVDATFRGRSVYSIDYFSIATDFTSDKTQFYGPMEQSFVFAS